MLLGKNQSALYSNHYDYRFISLLLDDSRSVFDGVLFFLDLERKKSFFLLLTANTDQSALVKIMIESTVFIHLKCINLFHILFNPISIFADASKAFWSFTANDLWIP